MPLTLPPDVAYRRFKCFGITVTTSATQVDLASLINGVENFKMIVLMNNNAAEGNSIYIGHSASVTASAGDSNSGMPIVAQDYWLMHVENQDLVDIYAIAGGSSDLRVMLMA